MSYSYLPPLSTVLKPKDLPAELNFLNEAVDTLFGNIYLKEYQVSANHNFASVAYYAVLTSYRKIGIEIPGTGLMLILNPQFDENQPNSSTEIPVSVNFDWPIKRVIQSFNLDNFAADPLSFLDLIQDYLGWNDSDILGSYVARYIPYSDIQTAVTNINSHYNLSPLLSVTTTGDFVTDIYELSSAIYLHPQLIALNKNPSKIIKEVYLSGISGVNELIARVNSIFHSEFGKDSIESIKKLIIPNIEAKMILSAGLEIPRSVLVPLDANGNPIMPQNPNDPLPKTILKFAESEFTFSTENGIGFEKEIALTLLPQLSRIGNTPFTIGFTYAKLDFSRTTNIPEADLDGRPKDFIGVYIREATIGFPAFWNHDSSNSSAFIKGRNLLIGTGGISGAISLETNQQNGAAIFRLGDPGNTGKHFQLGLTKFLTEFKQGSIVRSEIRGYMKIPGFKDAIGNDAQLDIHVYIGNDGDFRVTASEADGIQVLSIPNVFDLTLRSVSIGREDDRWYIEASGSLKITAQIPNVETDFLKEPIDIKKVRIYQDGSIEFVGGSIPLPRFVHMKIGPVSLAIDQLGYGSHEGTYQGVKRQYFYFSFSGNLNVGGGSVDVRGDGVEFHFTRDAGPFHCYLRIAGIGVDIKIPGNATKEEADVYISGYLAMRHGVDGNSGNQLTAGPEYQGSVSINLNKLKINAKAGMILRPKVPAWIVDVELDIPTPIPLGPTGLGVYGFRGLVGSHYVASKPYIGLSEEDTWFEYLKKKVPPRNQQGIGIEKFDPAKKGFSLGVGASIATMGDDGWAFSSKVFVMVSIPEMLLIEGQANVLHKRLGIETEDDPPFYAFIVLDKNSVQAGIGVNYKIPDGGEILSVKGEMQLAFFFNNSSAWYINIGQELPPEKRLQARLFTILNAYAYLMISNKGIKAGAGAKFEKQARFGPVRVGLYAYIDAKGFISFKPLQIGGALQLGGGLYIKVGRFGIELRVAAGLSAEAPKPFIISGFIQVKIKIVFFKVKIKLEFTWVFVNSLNTDEVKLIDPAEFDQLPAGQTAQYPVKAINMLTSEAFRLKYLENGPGTINPYAGGNDWDNYVIPMDSYIDVEFKRPVKPYSNRYGGGINPLPLFNEYVAPQKAKMPQVKHTFTVESVDIKIWNKTSQQWESYNPWEALTTAFQQAGLTVNTSTYPFGYWQYNNTPGKYTSLRIFSQTPFSVSNGVAPENYGILSQHLLCQGPPSTETCQYWHEENPGKVYLPDTIIHDRKLYLKFNRTRAHIDTMPNPFGIAPSLKVKTPHSFEIIFKEPMPMVHLRLTALGPVHISYYGKVYREPGLNGLPNHDYDLIYQSDYNWQDLMSEVIYEDGANPVSKVVIEPMFACSEEGGPNIEEYWAELLTMWESNTGPVEDWQYEQVNQWLQAYQSGNPLAIAFEQLYNQWKVILNTPPAESEAQREKLETWMSYWGREDYETIFDELCSSWAEVVEDPEQYGTLVDYVQEWQELYCHGGFEMPELDLCSIFLHSVCFKTEAQWELDLLLYQNNQSVINAGINSLSQAINQALPPIWRPDSAFAVVVNTRDQLNAGNNTVTYNKTHGFGFKTTGTLGFYHKDRPEYLALLNYQDASGRRDKSDQYKLANLRHYIDYQRSYPEAGGNLIGAKPVYYENPKIRLFFTKPYVYEFFTSWGAYKGNPAKQYQLLSLIMDPLDKPGDPPVIPAEVLGWHLRIGVQAIPINAFDIQTISNIISQGNPNCTGITNILKPPTVNAEIERTEIKPQKMYTAIFKAVELNAPGNPESVVHSYTFTTSKYRNFIEHIESYKRTVTDNGTGEELDSNAFFPVTIEKTTAQLADMNAKLQQVVNGTLPQDDGLIMSYASVYDRIVTGVLELQALQAPTDTEFNVIKTYDTTTSQTVVLGVLVKSPEPFNDPRLPAAQMGNTLAVTDQQGNQFIYVFSNDNSSVFVTRAGLSLPLHTVNFAFKRIQFNGAEYATYETVNVPVDLSTI